MSEMPSFGRRELRYEDVAANKGSATDSGCTEGPCVEAQEHVWEVIDGEMSADDCARIRAHFEACPPCDEVYHNERKVKDVVARACGCESAPQDLRGRVTALIVRLRIETCGSAKATDSTTEVRRG